MPPRTPGQQPGASVHRTAGQHAGQPRTSTTAEYVVKPHPAIGGLLCIHWHKPGVPDGAPIVTVREGRLPLVAAGLDRYLARHSPVLALADALAQARAALAGDSAMAREDALRDIAGAVGSWLGGTVGRGGGGRCAAPGWGRAMKRPRRCGASGAPAAYMAMNTTSGRCATCDQARAANAWAALIDATWAAAVHQLGADGLGGCRPGPG